MAVKHFAGKRKFCRGECSLKIFRLFMIALLLTGCATLSREECQHGDWYGVGMADGQAGEPAGRFNEHVKACSEYGVSVDNRQYLNGRTEGLIDYCRVENAFDTGLQGHRYQHVCPSSIGFIFARYNEAAYQVYQARIELDGVESQIRYKETQLQKKDLSDDKRRQIRSEIHDMDFHRNRVRDDLRFKEDSLNQMMDEARLR
jgi:hypothetical protein